MYELLFQKICRILRSELKMVTISIEEYEKLVRDSERLLAITNYAKSKKYVNDDDVRSILGIEINEEGSEE